MAPHKASVSHRIFLSQTSGLLISSILTVKFSMIIGFANFIKEANSNHLGSQRDSILFEYDCLAENKAASY